ncbi:MAG: ABC transporter permease [Variibacter sp.]
MTAALGDSTGRRGWATRWNGPRLRQRAVVIALLLVVGYLIIPPIAALLLGSITDTPPDVWPNFTLSSLYYAYTNADHYWSLALSLIYASTTATCVLVVGGFLAWLESRTDSYLRHLTDVFALAPIIVPAVLFVTAWLLLLGPKGGLINQWAMQTLALEEPPFNLLSLGGMIWVGILQELPLAFLWLWPAFRSMNSDLEDAGLMAGATSFTVIRRITLPLLRPAILSGWLMFFIYSLGALAVPLMIGLPAGYVLYSTEIYLAVHRVPSDLNLASAYSLLLVLMTFAGVAVYRHATREVSRFTTVTGKAFNPRLVRLGRWRWPINLFGLTVLFLCAGLPILVLVWNAFLPFPQLPSAQAFSLMTLENFRAAMNYGPAIRALYDSIVLGLGAGVVSTILGCIIAWCTLRFRGMPYLLGLLDQLSTVPIAMPGLIVGVSVLWLYLILPLPIYGTLWILLIAYITLHLPYAVRICASSLAQLHPELEEAGYVSGANWLTVFRRIILALMAPSLVTSVLYVGLRSFREYSASILLAGPGSEVFSVMVLDMWDGGNLNILCAYVTVVMVILGTLIVVASQLGRRLGTSLH